MRPDVDNMESMFDELLEQSTLMLEDHINDKDLVTHTDLSEMLDSDSFHGKD